MLHPSRPWVPLFHRGIWTPMSCGSWVPLVTKRHHGLSISPVQRERTVASGPGAPLVMFRRPAETDGLTPVSFVIPVPPPLPPAGHHRRPNGWELIVAVQYATLVLRMTAGEALVPVAIVLLLPMPAVAAVPLPHTPNVVALVLLHWPAWLGALPGTRPCRPGPVLPHTRCSDHPGAVLRPLAPGGCPLIVAAATLHLGHPHLDIVGNKVPILAVHAPGLLTGIVNNVCTRRTNILYAFMTLLLFLHRMTPRRQIRIHQLMTPRQLSAEAVKKLFDNLLYPPASSYYAEPYPATNPTNTQLVPYNKDAAKVPTTLDNDELDTHDGLFKNYKSFHRLSGEQDREARTSAYHELINLMLSQTSEDKQLINVTAARPKTDGPFRSNLEAQPELKKKQDKLHLQWPPIKETQRVVNRTLGLYQHGQQPKAGSSSYQWPPPTVENPWNKEFSPKDFPTAHKIPSTLPKRWELHEDSPLMLKPPTSTVVDQVPDAEIAKCSSWLEAFAARSAHSATISSTSLEAVYNFMQKVIIFLRSSMAKDSIENNAPLLHDLLQRANSTFLEAQLMSHDAGVTATELFTHLHMLRRHTVLESPSVHLPQRDKDRLLVMSVGGNDLFCPNTCKVQEWKRDTEEEKVKLISRVFDEWESRDKAAKKKSSSSSTRPPRSFLHQSPLDAISTPRSKESYQRPPCTPRVSPFGGILKNSPPTTTSPDNLLPPRDSFPLKTRNLLSLTSVQAAENKVLPAEKKTIKGLSSPAPSTKEGGAEVEISVNRTDSLPVGPVG